ncbi:3-deoxy-7-phosphoheptulonate synthase [Sporanaerobium hydrogeniformans]|uniref:3-deoxy-7-phosphoheptulonate synthase n=1 Tax=Sporanaerobium hydrogeniformans TaxID=3072179 RepID=A0AC61DDR9_9FIRM|nr:3-deoxy-7-phosphoheptulonate synthase [Sporanaerobium hydrogeniformans]PHV70851.1 3-deoxy-7-phosphoheptulonate synthase [Sporanaerobium hydrogeniformans]
MIIVVKNNIEEDEINKLMRELTDSYNIAIQKITGSQCTVLGVVGDSSAIELDDIARDSRVEKAMRVKEPFKKANRAFHPDNSIYDIAGRQIGGKDLAIIAGPCSVESESQIIGIAEEVKAAGATFLRGGAYKPRTSPYAFQGLEAEGLELLKIAREKTGLPIVTEIMDPSTLDKFVEDVDVIQVGARNMQNFSLLKLLGQTNKPILLKRGLSSTIEEWIMSAEYIMAGGNNQVILCERGVRTFETYTRNTLDLSAIAAIKKLSHLPIIVDPSHATGLRYMVEPMCMAAIAAGADGLIIEVHNNPPKALCDGPQSVTPNEFKSIVNKAKQFAALADRDIKEVM